VADLAERRARAREARDFATADALRDEIAAEGWMVADGPDGFTLGPKPPYEVWPTVRSVTSTGVGLLVDGWPDDLIRCAQAILDHTDAHIVALDLGNVDGAGDALHELATQHSDRIRAWHVAERPHWRGGSAGWGESRSKLLILDDGDVHVVMETSTLLEGDAIAPLAAAVQQGADAAGWQGVNPAPDGRDWIGAGPGEVRGLLGYLFAVERTKALLAGGFERKAKYYRNADLEFSLRLNRLVVPAGDLPVRQERHRGYHDVDPEYRDRESRRNYDRVLRLLRAP
jgi:hypothetical protein